ncbi:MAG: GntR family transcriptional regulator [Dorea sp.]|nr:GntR family transcriptional regulator [Dorea sp.]
MTWNLDNNMPIYLQLMDRIQRDIISGRYGPGDKLPSVRELAVEAAVNPNTMQKALSELERGGLVYSQRTSGRFITEDEELLKELKREQAAGYLAEFMANMHNLGLKDEEIRALFEEAMEGEKEE